MKGKTGGGISCSGGDPRDDLGVGEFAFGPSIMQMIAGLIAFGFGVIPGLVDYDPCSTLPSWPGRHGRACPGHDD
jgi:hypothetical protein